MLNPLRNLNLGLGQQLGRAVLVGVLLFILGLGSFCVIPEAVLAADIDTPGLVVVAGRIKIKPGTKEKFTELAEKCLVPSRKELGSISYSYYEDQTEPNTILYFEEWRNRAALDFHLQTPYFNDFFAQAKDLLAERPEIKVYTVTGYETL